MLRKTINHEVNASHYKLIDIVTVIFVLVLMLSNIGSSAKIVDWGISLFNLPLAFDAGTILFPISYVFGDILTEVYGFKKASRIILIGFVSLAFSAFVFWLIQIMPGEAMWEETVGQEAYNKILGGMSTGGIILASICGYLAGSYSNAIVMAVLKALMKTKLLWVRTISSTLVGEFLDTAIFVLIATITNVFPSSLYWSLTVTNYIFKVGVEVVMTPITYLVTNFLKKYEGIVESA